MVIAGIDIGGTFIKGGLCNEKGEILYNGSVRTECSETGLVEGVSGLVVRMLQEKGISRSELAGIGMGIPGMIDGETGRILYANNLKIEDFCITRELEEKFGAPVRITNDANAAALGEAKFGSGKGCGDSILVTLGTGVGGGVVLGGKIFEGNKGAGAELGHMVIVAGGEPCTCGRRGCLEAYASATALIRETRRAMERNPKSRMWEGISDLAEVDGRTAFAHRMHDSAAAKVVEEYIYYLGEGLVSFASIFRPEVIILGGGVSKEGENLVRPLQEKMDAEIYGGSLGPRVEIRVASLGNRAGLVGAAALFLA